MGLAVMKRRVVLQAILEILDEFGIVAFEETTFKSLDLSASQTFMLADVLSEQFGCDYIDFDSMVTVGDLVDFIERG